MSIVTLLVANSQIAEKIKVIERKISFFDNNHYKTTKLLQTTYDMNEKLNLITKRARKAR
jgi:hypothetical protein